MDAFKQDVVKKNDSELLQEFKVNTGKTKQPIIEKVVKRVDKQKLMIGKGIKRNSELDIDTMHATKSIKIQLVSYNSDSE